ncbi:unnamed protein product [Paramecium primaurelia]|uniref:Uncharacterized protein n=1 Tax=Paramecium primaurelia TaxID=5886 RepID=A0A8S1Q922_PARPR|nr:unnamed protein product [Paramecium primaurelia]
MQQLESQTNSFSIASRSCFQKHYDLFNQTYNLIKQQENREREYNLDQKDHFLSFALSILEQKKVFSQFQIFGPEFRKEVQQIQSKTNSFINLKRLIQENLDSLPQKDIIQVAPLIQNDNIIIIELDQKEVPLIKEFNNIQLNEFDYKDLLNKKTKENLEFWESQKRLGQLYQQEIQNLIKLKDKNETLVYVVRQMVKNEDIKSHFLEYFIIKQNENNTEDLCLDYINNGNEKYIPYTIFNQLFEDSVINPIVKLSKINKQADFFQIQQCLDMITTKPIQVYNKLIKIQKNCKIIIRWVNLLQNYLQQFQQINRVKYEENKLQEIKDYLFSCYMQLDKNFHDEFYDVRKEGSFDIFLNFQDQIDKCSTSFSIILYQIKKDALLLYQKYRFGSENMSVLAKLEFPTFVKQDNSFFFKSHHDNQYEDNQIDLDQLSLVEKENGYMVYNFKFELKEENQYLFQSQNTKYYDLIMEIIMKCISRKMKSHIFNPAVRRYLHKISYTEKI